jgi:AcrR family transcriptional regulator
MDDRADKEDYILCAAKWVFVRYGLARTTMGDIAKAGMSRPALYLQFKDKEAIFSRVIENMDAQALTKIRTAIAKIGRLDEKLLHACTSWGMHGVELAAGFPDAADLFDLRFPAVRQVYRNVQALVVEILQAKIKKLADARFSRGLCPDAHLWHAGAAVCRSGCAGYAAAYRDPCRHL